MVGFDCLPFGLDVYSALSSCFVSSVALNSTHQPFSFVVIPQHFSSDNQIWTPFKINNINLTNNIFFFSYFTFPQQTGCNKEANKPEKSYKDAVNSANTPSDIITIYICVAFEWFHRYVVPFCRPGGFMKSHVRFLKCFQFSGNACKFPLIHAHKNTHARTHRQTSACKQNKFSCRDTHFDTRVQSHATHRFNTVWH